MSTSPSPTPAPSPALVLILIDFYRLWVWKSNEFGRLSGERISSRLGIIKSDYEWFPTTRTAQPTPKSDELERGTGGRAKISGFGDSVLLED